MHWGFNKPEMTLFSTEQNRKKLPSSVIRSLGMEYQMKIIILLWFLPIELLLYGSDILGCEVCYSLATQKYYNTTWCSLKWIFIHRRCSQAVNSLFNCSFYSINTSGGLTTTLGYSSTDYFSITSQDFHWFHASSDIRWVNMS